MLQFNPFIVEGYKSPEYFCDRVKETEMLTSHLLNQRNVALIAKRRLGKSGLILNCFNQKEIRDNYYTFYVDIYDTKNLTEFTYELGKSILTALKPIGRKAWEAFVQVLKSLRGGVTFDVNGNPEWSISLGDMTSPDVVLDEIFSYLENANRPCLVAIDEFQVIADYPEKTVEASLRKRIQNCHNVHFVYSGSKHHMMSEMFVSHARPFYNSSALMGLGPIDMNLYYTFANGHFAKNGQSISEEAFAYLYEWADGVTWYIQFVLNMLYSMRDSDIVFAKDHVVSAIDVIVENNTFAYKAMLYQLAPRQKQILYALAKEGKVSSVLSKHFLHRHSLTASAVQGAISVLQDRDFVTRDDDAYRVYDLFFEHWMRK